MSDPLVEEPTAVDCAEGGKLFYSLKEAGNAYGQVVTEGEVDLGNLGAYTFAVGLDALSFIANPFKYLVQAGVSWLFEHISFLREPLNWLAGNPHAIEGLAGTWNNIAMELSDAAEAWTTELQSTVNWEGEDAEAYRASAGAFGGVIGEAANGAVYAARAINGMGVLIALERSLFLEIISNFIAEAVLWALSALATSVFTFGATAAAAVARIVYKAVSTFASLVAKLGQLMSKIGCIVSGLRKFGTQSTGLKKTLDRATDQLLKGTSFGLMRGGGKVMDGSQTVRLSSYDSLQKSLKSFALENDLSNPINGLKVAKYTGTSYARGQDKDSEMAQEREENGGP